MKPGRLVRVAERLAAALGEGAALAGGLAVAAWGEIRATRDVDFVTLRPLAEVEQALREADLTFVSRSWSLRRAAKGLGSRFSPWKTFSGSNWRPADPRTCGTSLGSCAGIPKRCRARSRRRPPSAWKKS
jgi:hypothetical protein